MTASTIEQIKAQTQELFRSPVPDPETPLFLFIAVSLLLWMLVSVGLGHAGRVYAAAYATAAPYVWMTMTVLFLAVSWVARRFRALSDWAGKNQASFDAWASQQNWSVAEWGRVARSPELAPALTLAAQRWLEVRRHASSSPVLLSNETDVPAVFQSEPSVALVARQKPSLFITLALALPAVPLGVAAVSSWVFHAPRGTVGDLVMGASLVGLVAVALIALTRLQSQAQAAAIAKLTLPVEEWIRIESSSRLHEDWRPLIREHLSRTSPGWSLLPPGLCANSAHDFFKEKS